MKRNHWFCFSFSGRDSDGNNVTASAYTGYPDTNITILRIKENKKYAGVNNNAVLIACSYLGFMTKDEITEGTENNE